MQAGVLVHCRQALAWQWVPALLVAQLLALCLLRTGLQAQLSCCTMGQHQEAPKTATPAGNGQLLR